MLTVVLLLLIGTVTGYYLIFKSNVSLPSADKQYLYIPTGAGFDDVLNVLADKKMLKDKNSFVLLAKSTGYDKKVIPGKYRLWPGMNNYELIRLLHSGKQEPVKLIIKGSQSMDRFIEYVASNLEIKEGDLREKLGDESFLGSLHLKKETAPCFIIPNTYEMFWNISLNKFLEKMEAGYEKFWNEERMGLCRETGLTRTEVVTMASIIEKETDKDSELPVIAGVYMNRLSKGMKLQADPTVLFAINGTGVQRVGGAMLDYDSPYNTYKYAGLPPGPICIPSVQAVDAVLHYQKHDYIYFCARPDGSGYSDFTASYKEHQLNAKRFQKYLDEHNIK